MMTENMGKKRYGLDTSTKARLSGKIKIAQSFIYPYAA
jgi:hypothetical protein